MSRLLGDDPFDENPEWLQEYRRLKNWLLWEKWAANRYAERLLNASAQLRYVVPYPVREKLSASPKYYLLFATRSAKPMPVMNDILCLEEDNLFDGVRKLSVPPQLSFFNTVRESELESRLVGLMDDIHSYGMANQNCGRDQIIEHFVFDRPASFKKKHYRNAVDRLVETGRARFGVGPKESAPMTFI